MFKKEQELVFMAFNVAGILDCSAFDQRFHKRSIFRGFLIFRP